MPRILAARHRLPLFGLALVLLLSGCGGDYRTEGIASFESRRFNEAIDRLRIALSQDPSDVDVKYLLAVSMREVDRTGEAATLFEQLIAVPEYKVRAANQVVRTLLKADRIEDARSRLKKALEQDPDDLILIEALGEVEFAEYRAVYARIEEFAKTHVGKRGLGVMNNIEVLICAETEHYEATATKLLPRIQKAGIGDLDGLVELIQEARVQLGEAESLFRQVVAGSKSAFQSRVKLGQLAALRKNVEEVENLLLPVARMKETQIEDPDLRTQLYAARFMALATVMGSLRQAKLPERALTLTEEIVRDLPDIGSLAPHIATLLYETKQYGKLERLVGHWYRRSPRNADANFYRGFVAYKEQRFEESLNYFERAVGVRKEHWEYNKYLGLALLETKNLQRASAHLQTALNHRKGKKDPELIIATSRAYEELGNTQSATKVLTRALLGNFRHRRKPGHEEIQQALTEIYERIGQVIETLQDARRVYSEDPQNPLVALELARLELEAGNLETARQLADDILRASPELPDAWLIRAHVQIAANEWRDALKSLDKVEALNPGDASVAWLMARAHFARRKFKEARAAAQLALDREADLAGPALILLEADLAERKFPEAESRARALLERFPKDPTVVASLAEALSAQEKWTEAVGYLKRLRTLEPESPKAALDLGRALLACDKSSEATGPLLEAASLAKDDVPLREDIAKVLASAGQMDAAIATLEELADGMGRGRRRARILDRLMRLHDRARHHLRVLEIAVELRRSGAEADAMRRLAYFEYRAGAYEEAAAAVRVLESLEALDDGRRIPRGVIEALVQTGAWTKVDRLVRDGIREKRIGKDDYAAALARADFGMKRSVAAMKLINETLPRVEGKAQAELYAVWLGHLLSLRDREEAASVAAEAVARHPNDTRLRELAVRAAVLGAQYDQAESILESVEKHRDDSLLLQLAALRVFRRGYVEAAEALGRARSPEGVLARGVAYALSGEKEKRQSGFAAWLSALKGRRFDEAVGLAATLRDVPSCFRGPLASLARTASASPEDAALLADLMGRSLILSSADLLRRVADRELKQAAESLARHSWFIQHWHAWILLRYRQGKAAAGVAVPLLATGDETQTLTVYLAASAALMNAGASNVWKVVEGIFQQGDLPADLSRDLCDLMIARSNFDEASRFLVRNPKPDPEDHERRIRVAWETGEYAKMRTSLEALPASYHRRPEFGLVKWANDSSPEGKAKLKALLQNDEILRQVDPRLALWSATWLSDTDLVQKHLDRALAERPYDAWHLDRILQMLARSGAPRSIRRSLETALTVVDPFAKLRKKAPHQRRRPDW